MLWLTLDRESGVPMIRQIHGQIRKRILEGRLEAGTRLPSSRELAEGLGVSRNVVLEAYDLLYAEGFTRSRRGSGTFIAPGAFYPEAEALPGPEAEAVSMGYDTPPGVINFKPGTPDLGQFPVRTWLSLLKGVYGRPREELLAYGHPEGRMELREAICRYVVEQRGVRCHPEQIVITAGTTQAIGIVCSLLLGRNREVILEDPITRDIQLIVRRHGGVIHPVPVDDHGLDTDRLPSPVSPALIYVTPSHQFPLGGTLPIQRRIALLRYAESRGAMVVEDDYDSEFRFDGPPVSSLHGLSPDRVIYIGTFSKTLCPAIRTGHLVLPPHLITRGRTLKWHNDLHNETPTQLALAEFIAGGHYRRHLSKMKKRYRKRRDVTENALEGAFGDGVRILGSATGLHLTARFEGVHFTDSVLERMEARGVRLYPAAAHCIRPDTHGDALILGFGNLEEEKIEEGIEILREFLEEGSFPAPIGGAGASRPAPVGDTR